MEKKYGVFKKLQIELLYHPVILLLGIYQKKLSQRNFCTLMFTVALFTIDRAWKQPKYLSTVVYQGRGRPKETKRDRGMTNGSMNEQSEHVQHLSIKFAIFFF